MSRLKAFLKASGRWCPDLAVEIISPNDLPEKVSGQALEYLEARVRQAWIVSPEHRTITIFRSPTQAQILAGENELLSDDSFPGFRCPLSAIFQTQ